MIIDYYFDDSDSAYEYDADLTEFLDDLALPQICFLAKDIYNSEFLDDEMKRTCETEFGCSSPEYFDNYHNDDVQDCAKYIIEESDDNVIMYFLEDYVKKFFESDAYEAYKDDKAYHDDPYAYNGVSPSDFH